jgi:hypothetical protein
MIKVYCLAEFGIFNIIVSATNNYREHAVAQWLRHCTTNRKIAGSIPDGVRIFN